MKKFNKAALYILYLITITLLIFFFKWAGQDTTSLPGLPVPESESFFEIINNNTDVAIVSLIGSIPIFYLSLFFLTPKLLFKKSYTKIALYVASLTAYIFAVILITDFVFPMYYFFGTPYAIKVLVPIVLISGLGGTLFAFAKTSREKIVKEVIDK
jgi:hypothetical protein